MPYRAIRYRQGRPFITFIDDNDDEERDAADEPAEEGTEHGEERPLPPSQEEESSSTIAPLSEGPKQEFFLIPMNVQPRSIASMPEPDSDFDLRRPELSAEEQRREKMGWHNYKEVEWPVSGSSNTFNSADSNAAIRLQRDRERAKDLYNRNYMRSRRGEGGRYIS